MEPCVVPAAPDDAGDAPPPTGGLKRKRYAFGSMDEFEEISRLGEGAFGAVFRARHRKTGRAVAIKRLAPALGGRAGVLREASFLEASGRDNPFVVRLLGVASRPGTGELCLVMECGGQSIRDLLRRRPPGSPPLPEKTVCAVMWQLLTATKKMHDSRIVHRDIKPANILLSDDRMVVKICDFGVAMHMAARPPYASAGTRCYMAPEMLLKKRDYNTLVDTWSLGCVMAELVTGRRLFQGVADDDTPQLCAIFNVLGVPDEKTWPWFSSTRFATDVMPELDLKQRENLLRDQFPESKLSKDGFDLLSGLLTCNPEKRLTAAAALNHAWFAKIYASNQVPKKVDEAPSLAKRQRMCVA
ncbi:hypothetical protein BS78_01G131500 [Paspalum vaginatum]|nr:hypothetical protein BS78_01G131500 [Paspalum vaginatum]